MEAERLTVKLFIKMTSRLFIEDLFPLPEGFGEIKEKNILSLRDNLHNSLLCPRLKMAGNTPWKMMLAVFRFVMS